MAPFEDLNHLLLIRLLRRRSVPPRLKSKVTEPARVPLPLKVMSCASTADYDNGRLMAATPEELSPAFHFSSNQPPPPPPPKKTESGKLDQTNYSVSAGEIWQLSLIHDAYWNQDVYVPWGEAGGGKLTFFHAEDLTQAAGRSRGNRCNIYVFYPPSKPSLSGKPVALPFTLSSWNTCPFFSPPLF